MKRKIHFIIVGWIVSLSYGCATSHKSVSTIPVEIHDTNNVSVVRACAHVEDDNIVIHGNVKRDYFFKSHAWGHIDVALLDENNKIIEQTRTNYLPRHLSRKTASSLFRARFNLNKLDDVHFHVSYHNVPLMRVKNDQCASINIICSESI